MTLGEKGVQSGSWNITVTISLPMCRLRRSWREGEREREGERGREREREGERGREGGREGGRRWEGERGREEVCSSPYELASIVSSEPGKPEIMGLNLVQGSSAYFFVNGQLLLCPVFL